LNGIQGYIFVRNRPYQKYILVFLTQVKEDKMKNLTGCDIENTVIALQEAIENKKMQIQTQRISAPSGFSLMLTHLFSEILKKAGGPFAQMSNGLEHGGEFIQEFLKKAQQSIQEKPWEVLRVVAVSSFGIGLFLSARRKTKPTGEK
jgi:hypothetical protein